MRLGRAAWVTRGASRSVSGPSSTPAVSRWPGRWGVGVGGPAPAVPAAAPAAGGANSSRLIWRVASKLLSPGMPMSIRTTSGRNSAAFSTASPPLEASPTTSMSGSDEISWRTPCLNSV